MVSLRKLLLCLFTATAGCALSAAPATSTTPAAAGRGRIVVLGDSITAGYGLSPEKAYPAVLQQKVDAEHLPFQVVNAGVSGDTTAGGLRRIDWALSAGAKVLVVALGGNDGLRGLPTQQTAANITAIIKKARAKIPDLTIIIAGMQMPANMGADFVRAYGALFPQVAKENNAQLVPYLLKDVGGIPEMNQADFIHPTEAGQKKVADNVWPVLKKALGSD